MAYTVSEHATFNEPWAIRFIPGMDLVFVTEKGGTARLVATGENAVQRLVTVSGLPEVDYGGQGGLGDVAFLPSEASDDIQGRTIYLSYAEAGEGDTRGAAVGRGTLRCWVADECAIEDWQVIWRQAPKVTGRGHYSHRIVVSPDGQHLYVASGDRQKMEPAQDNSSALGTIVRLKLDGTPDNGGAIADDVPHRPGIWSWGHRNILGMDWDAEGRLWEVEHGPKGGDELNLVVKSANYGWPVVSDGIHYDNEPIPDHKTRPEFAAPKLGWTPVIAPGDMRIYRGAAFPAWRGHALIAGLKTKALVVVELDGERAREAARFDFGKRLRGLDIAPDGSVWVIEDGENARLLKLTPKS